MNDVNAFEADIRDGALVVSEVDPSEVEQSLQTDHMRSFLPARVYRALSSWAEDTRQPASRNESIFDRNRFVTPGKVFEQFGMAYDALDDDIVGSVADTSEAMAFQKVAFECEDKDQEDVWNQIGRDLDLDTWVRQGWRELFTVSQFYGVIWWGLKSYKVRGKREERDARKTFELRVPLRLGFLDPTRVVPVQSTIFGGTRLAWIASDSDMEQYESILQRPVDDPLVSALFDGKYKPTEKERETLTNENIPEDNLLLLNQDMVFRHTLTKSPFERWARVRMKALFPLLDLKNQLRAMDRAFLLGGVNFIVLVTRGTDERPTNRTEVEQTTMQMRTQSRSPVIVSDHRINIEIITPDVEHILNRDKWMVLDERLMMRLWGTFQMPSEGGSRDTALSLGRVIAKGLQNRRHMLKRSIEAYVIRPTIDMAPKDFSAEAKIEFAPRRMELDMDQGVITMLQSLRDRGDISRETILREFNFDQGLEAQRREYEDDRYKNIFKPVNVPFDSPSKVTPDGSGRTGGRPAGTQPTQGSQ